MKTYQVVVISDAEYAKAEMDPAYSPVETLVGEFSTDGGFKLAHKLLKAGMRSGAFPFGSEIVEIID